MLLVKVIALLAHRKKRKKFRNYLKSGTQNAVPLYYIKLDIKEVKDNIKKATCPFLISDIRKIITMQYECKK